MNDHARALRDHRGKKRAIEADRRHQVQVDLARPNIVIENGKPRRGRWSLRAR
jgi:hypothetical protein